MLDIFFLFYLANCSSVEWRGWCVRCQVCHLWSVSSVRCIKCKVYQVWGVSSVRWLAENWDGLLREDVLRKSGGWPSCPLYTQDRVPLSLLSVLHVLSMFYIGYLFTKLRSGLHTTTKLILLELPSTRDAISIYIEKNLELVSQWNRGIGVTLVGSSYSLPRFNPIIPCSRPDTKTETRYFLF